MFVYWRTAVNPSDITSASRPALPLCQAGPPADAARWRRFSREFLLLVLVVVTTALALRGPADTQVFSIDESRWIATSRYFWITVLDGDLFGPAWQPNYIVLTHPPLARYIIGFGLWLQGWQPDQLNGRYDSLQPRAYNDREGNVPGPRLLADARRVTFVFAVTAMTLLYAVARQLGGTIAGLVAVALALVNPLLSTAWTRALAESIVATFGLLALWLALWTLPRVVRPGITSWQPLALGAALALAAATKLNGALGALGLGIFVLMQQGFALAATRRTAGFRYWVDVGIAASILFVAVNPLLYQRPTERIVLLVQHRQDEMAFQRMIFVRQAVPEALSDRVRRVALRVFDTNATPHGDAPLAPDVLLVVAGLAVTIRRSAREVRRRVPGPAVLFLCWTGATYAVVTANLGFDSSHYYVPLVALNMVLIGVAVDAGVHGLLRLRTRRYAAAGLTA